MRKQDNQRSIIGYILTILIGLGLLFFSIRDFINAKESISWPCSQGRITSSWVRFDPGAEEGSSYQPRVTYEFYINWKRYEGNRIAFGDNNTESSFSAQRIVDRYPVGKEVKVYYKPDNPHTCLLEPGLKAQAYYLLIVGLIFFGQGIYRFINSRRASSANI